MVKVLKSGVIPVIRFYGTCKHCGCEVEAEKADHVGKWHISNHKGCRIGILCPTESCGETISCRQRTKEETCK